MSKSRTKGVSETTSEPSPITISVATEEHIRKCHEWVLKYLDTCPAMFKKYVVAGVAAIVDSEVRQADKDSGNWDEIVKAVRENPDANPDAIKAATLGVQRQPLLRILRDLETFGAYAGFQHRKHNPTPIHKKHNPTSKV